MSVYTGLMGMKCKDCGLEVSNEAKFCSNCGSSLEKEKIEEKIEKVKVVYCKNCGTQMAESAIFCTSCGTSIKGLLKPSLEMADWGKRFVAWFIDIIILGFFLSLVELPGYVLVPGFRWIPFVDLGTNNLIHFLYWTLMEGMYGQSLGKMIMKIKVTNLDGKPADLPHVAIESIGKAFLLPIDCIIGWILYKDKNQRLFNYISETIVVKV